MSLPLPGLVPPDGKLVFERSSFQSSKSRHSVIIETHPFNHSVEVIVPGEASRNHVLPPCESECIYEASVPAYSLIHPAFIEAFIRRGSLQLMSIGTHIDHDNCLAITPQGHLILHLDKNSSECLGLESKPSKYAMKTNSKKFIVDIELLQGYFKPGKKNYERVRESLRDRFAPLTNIIFTWQPNDDLVSASSVQQYFLSIGARCKSRDTRPISRTLTNWTSCPVIDKDQVTGGENSVSHEEFWEWLGAASCDVSCSEEDFLSTYFCPQPAQSVKQMLKWTMTGLIRTQIIKDCLQTIRKHVQSGSSPWACITVHGFMDSPVSWATQEHSVLTEGDNLYTYVVFPDDSYWLYYGVSTYDQCP